MKYLLLFMLSVPCWAGYPEVCKVLLKEKKLYYCYVQLLNIKVCYLKQGNKVLNKIPCLKEVKG